MIWLGLEEETGPVGLDVCEAVPEGQIPSLFTVTQLCASLLELVSNPILSMLCMVGCSALSATRSARVRACGGDAGPIPAPDEEGERGSDLIEKGFRLVTSVSQTAELDSEADKGSDLMTGLVKGFILTLTSLLTATLDEEGDKGSDLTTRDISCLEH